MLGESGEIKAIFLKLSLEDCIHTRLSWGVVGLHEWRPHRLAECSRSPSISINLSSPARLTRCPIRLSRYPLHRILCQHRWRLWIKSLSHLSSFLNFLHFLVLIFKICCICILCHYRMRPKILYFLFFFQRNCWNIVSSHVFDGFLDNFSLDLGQSGSSYVLAMVVWHLMVIDGWGAVDRDVN